MLYITIRMNNTTAEYTIKQNTEVYNNPFVNNKQKIYDVMVETAEKLGCLDKGSNFKSLEFKAMTENFATIIYNGSKQIQVYFTDDYAGALCIHGINLRVTSTALVMAFALGDVVKEAF